MPINLINVYVEIWRENPSPFKDMSHVTTVNAYK